MEENQKLPKKGYLWLVLVLAILFFAFFYFKTQIRTTNEMNSGEVKSAGTPSATTPLPQIDFAAYDKKLNEIANNPPPPLIVAVGGSTSTPALASSTKPNLWPLDKDRDLWPVKTVYPNGGAILPFNRVVAYYGNLYSTGMGVLGEYPEEEMLKRLNAEVKKWQAADPETKVLPALHYIAVVAQAGPGKDGKYRARMPDSEIDKVLAMAQKINGIVFLDLQVGLSDVQTEVPPLEKYLKLPQVHLGIDPEFAMHNGARPGTEIGTLDAADVNFAANYLAKIVQDNNLPPKILIVHRFTKPMLTNSKNITPLPEVQIVMDMDGFGGQSNKLNTYNQFIYKEPVQFTGFKLFYKNDIVNGALLGPKDLLKLSPIPVYIQYQ